MDDIHQIKERYGAPSQDEEGEKFQDRVSEAAQQAKVKSQEFWEDTASLIREHPAASIGIALLTGAVIGGLIAGGASSEEESTFAKAKNAVARGSESLGGAKEGITRSLTGLRSLIDEALTKLR